MELNLNTNRSFLYGDGFFETFLLTEGKCDSFGLHFQRICKSLKSLQMQMNENWDLAYFENLLMKESRNFSTANLKVRITFYRDSTGTYLPESDSVNFNIKLEPYTFKNLLSIKAGIYTQAKKSVNFLSSIKTTSCLMFVMAAKYAKEQGWDEIIILNEEGRVCEALSSNIFIKKDGQFYTPPLSEGCVDGISRKSFLLANPNTIERAIELEDLKTHEVYFTNAVRGMIKAEIIF